MDAPRMTFPPDGCSYEVRYTLGRRGTGLEAFPDEFDLGRPAHDNLLYGAGIHVCPGAPLARLELRVLTEELLAATDRVAPDSGAAPERTPYPGSGFSTLPVLLS